MNARTIFLSHTSLMAHVPEGRSFVQAARGLELEVFHTLREALPPAAPSERRLQHLPYLPANFIGRRADLDEAERLIRSTLASGAALSLVGFRGMGGIGKTALAAALA